MTNQFNHIDAAMARSLAVEHAHQYLSGGYTVCPFAEGSREREAYDEKWTEVLVRAGEL